MQDDHFGFGNEEDAEYNSEDSEESFDDTPFHMVRTNTIVGTANYLSPEVIGLQDQTVAIDIWALGNILFKMKKLKLVKIVSTGNCFIWDPLQTIYFPDANDN